MIRISDILFSMLALLVLLPIFVCVATILKITGEGEVFYFQERVGSRLKTFQLWKFATMLKNSASMVGGTITTKSDTRILPVGRFLRATKINELPQLINVLKGDMSLIGPRPLTSETFEMYSQETRVIITKVRPGLSGIGSIVFRNEEELLDRSKDGRGSYSKLIAPYKGDLERWFVNNRSFFIYIKLIAITVWVVFFPKSNKVWDLFRDLPEAPKNLKDLMSR